MVRLTEDKIINLGQHMFIRNKIVDLWHQEYIIDTINKKLLRVRTYFQICDTFVVDSHDPTRPLSFKTACGSMAYTFFYNDNILIKINSNIDNVNYYVKDSVFIADEPSGLRVVNVVSTEYQIIKNAWSYAKRNISLFKKFLNE